MFVFILEKNGSENLSGRIKKYAPGTQIFAT